MKGTLKLPIKTALCDAAAYAKTLPPPHPKIERPEPASRSKLFEPEFVQAPKFRRPGRVRQVERGTFHDPDELRLAPGAKNRPDKSEQRTNLTFNWSPT
jgi:hypothetical protein